MKIALIGMSNIGKSHWSKKLTQDGFKRFGCDDLIEKKLETELRSWGYQGIHDVATWLGQPYNPQYAENSRKYVQCEQDVVDGIIHQIENKNEDVVIDTTGSVIYLGAHTLEKLKQNVTVIYFSTTEAMLANMYKQYLQHPKPVIWGSQFIPLPQETQQQTLARCYLNLLESRAHKYENLADITLDYERVRDPAFSLHEWLLQNKNSIKG